MLICSPPNTRTRKRIRTGMHQYDPPPFSSFYFVSERGAGLRQRDHVPLLRSLLVTRVYARVGTAPLPSRAFSWLPVRGCQHECANGARRNATRRRDDARDRENIVF